jgi:hypothetical protein
MSETDNQRHHITVRGPGRCTACSFHVATQSHRPGCDGTAEVTPDADPEWEAMGFIERLAHAAVDDPVIYAQGSALLKREADRIRAQRDGELATPAATSRPPTVAAAPGANPAYVRKAIAEELGTLAALPAVPNARNDTLNIVALKVFGFVKGGHADKQACWDELKRIGSAIGLTDSEMVGFDGSHGTLGSAWDGATPRQVPSQVVEI